MRDESTTSRERLLAEAFVDLADTLRPDYDVVEGMQGLVDACRQLLGISAGGLILADEGGTLHVLAASSHSSRLLELLQLLQDEGPCLDCIRSGEPVDAGDLTAAAPWPAFSTAALDAGFRSVHVLPLRLRGDTVGALNLLGTEPGELLPEQRRVGQALADVAAIGLLHERTLQREATRSSQLEGALRSRVVIEQAKGVLSQRGRVDMDTAFARLRAFARSNNQKLGVVAAAVVANEALADQVLSQGLDTVVNR